VKARVCLLGLQRRQARPQQPVWHRVQQPPSAPRVTPAPREPSASQEPAASQESVVSAPRVTSAQPTVDLRTAELDPALELDLLARALQTRGKPAQ